MIPNKHDTVKILFKNGFVEYGEVLSWGSKEIILSSLKEVTVIKNTEEIFIYKILKVKEQTASPPKEVFVEPPVLESYEPDANLRAKKLVDLHKLRIEAEQENARQKLNSFTNPGLNGTEYRIPSLTRRT